jgi:putative transposase
VVTPAQRREAVSWLKETKAVSERCACRAVRQPRATQRRRHRGRVDTAPEAEVRLLDLAHAHPTWGCPQLHQQLRREGHRINHKRTERMYGQHGLALRRRRRRRLSDRIRQPLLQPVRPNQCWSMDFMGDSLADGRAYRTFNVIDDYARDALTIEIDISLTANRVVRVLDQLCEWHGTPEAIRSDNGPEFRSETVQTWAKANNIRWDFIQPGCPAQNAYVERFNGTYRLEVLDANQFRTLDEARTATEEWLVVYNEQRTHSAIGHLPPLAFKRRWQQREFLGKAGVG